MNTIILDLIKDNAEPFIDVIFEKDSMVKDIPIIGNVISLCKLTKSISDRIFIYKLKNFMIGAGNNLDFKKYFEKNNLKDAGELIILAVEKIEHPEKSELLGKAYKYCAFNDIDGAILRKLSKGIIILDMDNILVLKQLELLNEPKLDYDSTVILNLSLSGFSDMVACYNGNGLQINSMGKILLECIK